MSRDPVTRSVSEDVLAFAARVASQAPVQHVLGGNQFNSSSLTLRVTRSQMNGVIPGCAIGGTLTTSSQDLISGTRTSLELMAISQVTCLPV